MQCGLANFILTVDQDPSDEQVLDCEIVADCCCPVQVCATSRMNFSHEYLVDVRYKNTFEAATCEPKTEQIVLVHDLSLS